MRRSRTIAAAVAVVASFVVLPQASASAGPDPGWTVGECLAKADVANDLVLLGSAVDCSAPHLVQISGGGRLAASFDQFSYAQIRDQGNEQIQQMLALEARHLCSGTQLAPVFWPKQGASIARAIRPPAATTDGGLLPGIGGIGSGWVFPEQPAFDAGDRSMICVVVSYAEGDGLMSTTPVPFTGDVRDMARRNGPLSMRDCYNKKNIGQPSKLVSCALPHQQEVLAFLNVALPVNQEDMTSEQWAKVNRQCQGIADAVIGAKRTDIVATTAVPDGSQAHEVTYATCYVQRPKRVPMGAIPTLPGGTVVGLGRAPLLRLMPPPPTAMRLGT